MFGNTRKKEDDYTRGVRDPFGSDVEFDPSPADMEPNGFDAAPAPMTEPEAQPMNASAALKIVSPKGYQDAQEIAGYLMNGNTVLLSVDGMAREQAVRLLDYLHGVTYAVGGLMTKVGKSSTIVLAPKNVDVSSIETMVGGN